jgi:hypothetical protein
VLTSGLDDYPRAKPPHVGELHLDLISWMGFFTRTMKEIAEFVGEEDDAAEFEELEEAILANIDGQSWWLSLFKFFFSQLIRSRMTRPALERGAANVLRCERKRRRYGWLFNLR